MMIEVAERRAYAEQMGMREEDVLRIAVEEGFVRRAALVGGPFALKGSYVTRQFMHEGWRRIPGDLDWVGTGELNEAELNQWITAVTEIELDDGIRFRSFKENAFWRRIDYAMDDDFPTVDTDLLAWVGETEYVIHSMDVSFGLKLVPAPHPLDYRPQAGASFTVPQVCPLELQIAWKLHQCLVRPRFKDIFDLTLLLRENAVDRATVWQALQDECLHDGTSLERFNWLLDGFLRHHPAWIGRVAEDFTKWLNNSDYYCWWEAPLALLYVGDSKVPPTLEEFLAGLSTELKQAGFTPVARALPEIVEAPENTVANRSEGLLERVCLAIAHMIKLKR